MTSKEEILGENVFLLAGHETTLTIECHGIVYSFSITRFYDGALCARIVAGTNYKYAPNVLDLEWIDDSLLSWASDNGVMLRPGTLLQTCDAALSGCLRVLVQDVRDKGQDVEIQYRYRWAPFVDIPVVGCQVVPSLHFKTRARLLNQLGEQLIKNEGVALLELIKNAYDADASLCSVLLKSPSDVAVGSIEILDDGCGMTPAVVRNVWLEIGTDHKERMRNDPSTSKTSRFGRTRLGEKGIGRLGVHRLGQCITLVTKSADSEFEVCLKIDWRQTVNANLIEDIPLSCELRAPKVFLNGTTGTKIIVTHFREPWTKRRVLDAARTIAALNSPFASEDSFNVVFDVDGTEDERTWLGSMPDFLDIRKCSMYSFDVLLRGSKMVRFKYDFMPLPQMDQSLRRCVDRDENDAMSRMIYPKGVSEMWDDLMVDASVSGKEINISDIGDIRFTGAVFDLSAKILSMTAMDKRSIKQFLTRNCGIKVFRDNMRILDYGEPGNDWLGLNARKLGKASSHISNSLIVASVNLDGDSSRVLQEKANREGFIENDAYNRMCAALTFCLERIDLEWFHDKDILRRVYEQAEGCVEVPVKSPIQELMTVIETATIDDRLRDQLRRGLRRVESDFDNMTNNLIKSAGAGLNLVMVIHQIEKAVSETLSVLKQNGDAKTALGLVKDIEVLVSGYSLMLKHSEAKYQDVTKVVEQSIVNVGFRLRAHGITLQTAYRGKQLSDGYYARGHLINAIINLFDNAIWWLGYFEIQNAGIYVDISEKFPGHISIVVADNGRGFTIPKEDLDKPFVTAKPGGMGIGLHLTSEIMRALGGKLIFPTREEFDVPNQYKGAVVALALRKGATV